jgi:predicted chitinase
MKSNLADTPMASIVELLPLSLSTLQKVMQYAPAKYLHPLNLAMSIYRVDTPKRVAVFLAQLAVESEELCHIYPSQTDFRH